MKEPDIHSGQSYLRERNLGSLSPHTRRERQYLDPQMHLHSLSLSLAAGGRGTQAREVLWDAPISSSQQRWKQVHQAGL